MAGALAAFARFRSLGAACALHELDAMKKKLSLNTETVRVLDSVEIAGIQGGTSAFGCFMQMTSPVLKLIESLRRSLK